MRARANRAPHLSGSPTMAYFVCGNQFLAWPFPGGVTGDAGTVQVGGINLHDLAEEADPVVREAQMNRQSANGGSRYPSRSDSNSAFGIELAYHRPRYGDAHHQHRKNMAFNLRTPSPICVPVSPVREIAKPVKGRGASPRPWGRPPRLRHGRKDITGSRGSYRPNVANKDVIDLFVAILLTNLSGLRPCY